MKRLSGFLKRLLGNAMDDRTSVYAGLVSFFIIISAIPMIMLLVPLIQFLIPMSEEMVLETILTVLPNSETMQQFAISLINDVYTNSTGTIISLSVIVTLWSASKGIYSLQQGLNSIYYTKETRNIIVQRLLSILYTIGFIFVLIFTIGVLLFGNKIQLLIQSYFPKLAQFSGLILLFRASLSIALFMLFFVLLFTVLPNRKHAAWRQIPGAAFATLGWMIFSYIYSLYIDNIAKFSYIYGSLTAIILLMLWLYMCMNIVLIGAELNKMLEDSAEKKAARKAAQLEAEKEKQILKEVSQEQHIKEAEIRAPRHEDEE